ncbi:type II secretion system F family protein [Herminiimonas sp. CN]|uniref:type II secretion system F family protein n=1 Tax=Herminiimonas sp. CN TaxID=1349818 RepID=UPI000473DAF8|nr:type II secretion system F family protein [Herminiimonas sp. CN]
MDTLYVLFGLAIFIAVVLLLEGVYTAWNSSRGPEAKRISRRLQLMSAGAHAGQQRASILKQRLLSDTPAIQRLLTGMPRMHILDKLIEQAGMKITVSQFLLMSFACGFVAAVLALVFHLSLLIAILPGVAAAGLPMLYLLHKKHQRLRKIEEQLPDALDLMSRALRAGHALPSAIKMVGDEMADPIASEFNIMFDEVNYGIPIGDALRNLSARVPSTDVGYFVVAVQIQRETGGNLTEILGNIAAIVRERLKLFRQIRTFSAEGRLSAWILCLLPFCLAAVINIVNPGFMTVLWTDPVGPRMLGVMAVFMVIGIFWMRKIIRIRV